MCDVNPCILHYFEIIFICGVYAGTWYEYVQLHVPSALAFNNSAFCPCNVSCVSHDSQQKKKYIIPYIILTVMEKQCVFCPVEPTFSKGIYINFKRLELCVTYQAFHYTEHISMAIFLASPLGLVFLKRSGSFNHRTTCRCGYFSCSRYDYLIVFSVNYVWRAEERWKETFRNAPTFRLPYIATQDVNILTAYNLLITASIHKGEGQ
jgi:hypothetical protein